jgi:hypothetical protein
MGEIVLVFFIGTVFFFWKYAIISHYQPRHMWWEWGLQITRENRGSSRPIGLKRCLANEDGKAPRPPPFSRCFFFFFFFGPPGRPGHLRHTRVSYLRPPVFGNEQRGTISCWNRILGAGKQHHWLQTWGLKGTQGNFIIQESRVPSQLLTLKMVEPFILFECLPKSVFKWPLLFVEQVGAKGVTF